MSESNNPTDDETLPKLRMEAYYYAFNETGVRCIDEILSAVARAGKGYHHTESWYEGGYIDQIQAAAGRAAVLLKTAPDLLSALRACADRMAIAAAKSERLRVDEPALIAAVEAIAKAEGRS